nr:STM3941 family protein [uncultured Chryseobacterium sp.]
MSDIIFKKNKPKYLFFLLLLLILIVFLLYFGVLWISNPNKYIFSLMPNKVIIILFSIVSILSALILLYIMLKSIFNKEFFLRINEKGLFLGIIQYSNKLIKWEDITKIEVIKINNIGHIMIYVNNIEYYKVKEKGIEKKIFISRVKRYGTPFVINTKALLSSTTEITESIILNWKRFK